MKRIIIVLLSAFIAFSGNIVSAYAQNEPAVELTKKQMKQIKKTAKSIAKQHKKEKWTLLESSTLQDVVTELLTLKAKGCQEIVGIVADKRDMVIAKTGARNSAINEYAEYCKSLVEAKITTDLQDLSGQEVNNLVAGYVRQVMTEIDGEIKPVFTLYKQDRNGIDLKTYFVVDIDAAAKAREKALKTAAEEAKLAHKYGDEIARFARSDFDSDSTIGE